MSDFETVVAVCAMIVAVSSLYAAVHLKQIREELREIWRRMKRPD